MQDIILHLGAHRTASTYVQGVLAKNSARLGAAGFASPSQESTRASLTAAISSRFSRQLLTGGFAGFIHDNAMEGARTLILSDENFLGFLNDIFSHHAFYPDTGPRLKRLANLLPAPPVKVVFALRPYTTFFPSAYSRWISPGRPVMARDEAASIILGLVRGWPDLIADISAAFPDSELVLAEYHSDAGFGLSQLHSLLGSLADELDFTTGYRWNRGMSAYQTHRFEEALTHGHHKGDSPEEIRALIRLGQPPLAAEFWDGPTRQALDRRYKTDLARIIEQYPAFVRTNLPEGQDAP
ncbi:MAG: hypothetical protein L3J37_03925 [Rhodobacteraceae bacterium]|nr:hypothetical protein [Paracoccaceae bacterium]